MSLLCTSSQTVGPYLHIGLSKLCNDRIAGPDVPGERVTIEGRVLDGDGVGIADALVELWQANSHGRYAHPDDRQDKPLVPGFTGWGRVATDRNGAFRFTTVKPGRVPGPDGALQAPHITVTLFMRGALRHMWTRIYFAEEPSNTEDPVLQLVPADRRYTLLARKNDAGTYVWNIHMQGEHETVFFDA